MKTEYEKELIDRNNNKSEPKKKDTNMLLGAFIIFIFPLISVFIGACIGGYIGGLIEASIVTLQISGGIVGLVLAIIVIKLFDKSVKAGENSKKIYWDDL